MEEEIIKSKYTENEVLYTVKVHKAKDEKE